MNLPDAPIPVLPAGQDNLPPSPAAQDAELARLREEHRDLDAAIEALARTGAHDQIQFARLKKRKLVLKDRISRLEDLAVPDITA